MCDGSLVTSVHVRSYLARTTIALTCLRYLQPTDGLLQVRDEAGARYTDKSEVRSLEVWTSVLLA